MSPAHRPGARIVGPAHLAGAAFDRADVALFVLAADHTVVEANRAARQRLGVDGETGVNLLARVPEHQQTNFAERFAACLETRQTTQATADVWLRDGSRSAVELTLTPIERPDGDRVVALAWAPMARVQPGSLESERHQILEMIAHHLPLEQVLAAVDTLVARRFPHALTAMIIRDGGQVNVVGGEQLPVPYRASLRAAAGDANAPLRHALDSGDPVVIADAEADQRWPGPAAALDRAGLRGLWVAPFAEAGDGVCAAMMLHFTEPTAPDDADLDGLHETMQLGKLALAEHASSRQLFERAYFDPVTGLPNRRLLDDRLGQALEYARRHDELVAVVLLDIDEFKIVNDSLGHAIGDQLLEATAVRLTASVRGAETVAYLGGDEFAVVLPVDDADDAAAAADELQTHLAEPIRLHGHRLCARASAGVALYPRDGERADTLLQAADTAMYAAKHAGGNRYRFHSAQLNARVRQRLGIESGLRRALERGELRSLYQPIVAGGDGRVVALEALLRWHHPDEGLLAPEQFLHQADASDLICELDQWLWKQAASDLEWLAGHGQRPKLSLNISPRDLQHDDFATRLLDTLAAYGVPPRRCELEITENVLMPDVARARDQIHILKRRAPELAIVVDDFGTGYASLNYLRELPIDGLKIDRSFINTRGGEDGSAAQAIARTVAELGHQLGLRVTAEGIEQADQRALACGIGCDRLQGFLFAPAMDRAALCDYLVTPAETASEAPRLGQAR